MNNKGADVHLCCLHMTNRFSHDVAQITAVTEVFTREREGMLPCMCMCVIHALMDEVTCVSELIVK